MICQPRSVPVAFQVILGAAILFAGGCLERKLKPLNPCLVSGVVAQVAVTNIDKVDMLFMVDNSDSMGDKQAFLRAQFPRLIQVMASGDTNGDGKNDFPPAKDLHLGVVTSDMGLPGIQGISNCQGLGEDGILQSKPSTAVMGCQASYPPFLEYKAGGGVTPMQIATDFQCIASVGTGGCGFEAQLEAPLKAVWPSVDPLAKGGMNRIQFRIDPTTGKGNLGHGDVENAQFLRNDPTQGLSLIAIIVLTDEDDCSIADTRPFTPPQFLDPADPLVNEAMNLRCHFHPEALYPIERYVNGFKALRPNNPNLVVFAAITGVPPELVDATALKNTNFDDETARDRFYTNILSDPRMMEVVNDSGTPNDPTDDRLVHSCYIDPTAAAAGMGQVGAADPPIRVVKTVQGFGANGIVQSICQKDYGPALDVIIAIIAKQLGAVCLPRPLVRNSDGTVGCNVVWELPPAGAAPSGTPVACGGSNPWLLPPAGDQEQTTAMGGQVCRVAQLSVKPDQTNMLAPQPTLIDGQTFQEGWYYDDFSDDVMKTCVGTTGKQRVSFTPNAKPPTGVTVKLECLNERQSLSNSRTDIVTQPEQPTVGLACKDMMAAKQGDQACYVQLTQPSKKWPDGVDRSMFCHPMLNLCVLSCNTDADCPAAWVCDNRQQTLAATKRTGATNGTPICVNPTCGDVM